VLQSGEETRVRGQRLTFGLDPRSNREPLTILEQRRCLARQAETQSIKRAMKEMRFKAADGSDLYDIQNCVSLRGRRSLVSD
jgi:hypothetical protein